MNKDGNAKNQPSDEFQNQMARLLTLRKKALKSGKANQDDIKKIFGEIKANKDQVNLNVFFLTFMPFSPDEMDDLGGEFEELFDEEWEQEDGDDELRFEISDKDEEFLKKHGLKF